MNELGGPSTFTSHAGVAGANDVVPPTPSPFAVSETRRHVRMAKLPGEGSFGMTLEQMPNPSPTDCLRASYVFPNSAASRAGIMPGWTIQFINGVSCIGREVSEIAPIFRQFQEVMLTVDIQTELPPGSNVLPPVNASYAPASNAFTTVRQSQQYAFTVPPPAPYTTVSAPMPTTTGLSMDYLVSPMAPVASSSNPVSGMNGYVNGTASATMASSSVRQHAMPPTLPSPQSSTSTWRPPAVPATAAAAVALPSTATATTAPAPQSTSMPFTSISSCQPAVAMPTSSAGTPATVSHANGSRGAVPTLVAASRPTPSGAPPSSAPMTSAAMQSAPTVPSLASAASATTVSTPPPTASLVQTTTATSAVTSTSAAAPAAAAPSTNEPGRAAGKRRRSQSDQNMATTADSSAPASGASSRRRGRQQRRRQSAPSSVTDIWDPEDAMFFYGSDDDPEVEEIPAPPPNSRRTSSRQAESGGRARRSLTVARLMTMGFTQEDAELSVQACGQDPDKCMLWIVSHLEEKQFTNDLNRASIESENQRRLEAQEQKKQESETLRNATAFTSLFQTSYILSDHADAPRLKAMLSSTIGDIAADSLMRTLMTKLLTVEGKAIRWYKEASKCYMLQLAARLETAFDSHDAITCCSKLIASESANEACAFVQALCEEEKALTKALFFMPENQGGVPLEFLRADESVQFSLDDDGFEVVDQPPGTVSPGRD